MRKSDADYYYAPVRHRWAVYHRHVTPSGITVGERIEEYDTREEARNRVYELNKWRIRDGFS